jgi:hypothetical protein
MSEGRGEKIERIVEQNKQEEGKVWTVIIEINGKSKRRKRKEWDR